VYKTKTEVARQYLKIQLIILRPDWISPKTDKKLFVYNIKLTTTLAKQLKALLLRD